MSFNQMSLITFAAVSHLSCSTLPWWVDIFDGLEQSADILSYNDLHPKDAIFCQL